VRDEIYWNREIHLRVTAAVAKARMPVPRSSQEDGSGTALGVGVRLKVSIAKTFVAGRSCMES
jgi:hypothetical protein